MRDIGEKAKQNSARNNAFKAGKFSVEDDTRPGRPKTSVTKANIAAVKSVVEQDARLSVIASCIGISEGRVQTILKRRLDLRKVCARWVRGSCKKFCHWVRITSVLRFIKQFFITNLQSIPPL